MSSQNRLISQKLVLLMQSTILGCFHHQRLKEVDIEAHYLTVLFDHQASLWKILEQNS